MKKIFKNTLNLRGDYTYFVYNMRNGYWDRISDLETLLMLNYPFYEENI